MHNILFRADSSSTIGTGHIMRDLVLAAQYKEANITFAVQVLQGNINHKIEEQGYTIKVLDSNDLEELDALIKRLNIEMIVIDHYGIDEAYENQLKVTNPTLKIMVLDDTYEKHHCDVLLNHNVGADKEKYKELVPTTCDIRCGIQYTLLRQEFLELTLHPRNILDKDNLNVFIAMGGADHSNVNIPILESLKHFDNIHVNIVTTPANKHLKELETICNENNNVSLYINTNKIAYLMNNSDFAIVTPSVTVNEIFYLQVPFIAVQTADNQKEIAQYLKNNDLLVLDAFDSILLHEAIVNLTQPSYYDKTVKQINHLRRENEHE